MVRNTQQLSRDEQPEDDGDAPRRSPGAGTPRTGIFVVDPGMHIVAVANELSLIDGASLPDEFRDTISYLPLT